ncbi:MAG: TlpA family protein disulfide reductase [Alphaproteobacteria bacterium]|nr:TlpA family protein disulfide reductase [Alphaproteobacteria bacterium]
MRRLVLAALLPGLFIACAPKAEVDELTARVEALEKRLEDVESRPVASGSAAAAGPTAADEEAAMKLYNEINTLVAENKNEEALAKTDELLKNFGRTRIASRAIRIKQELAVVGKTVGNPKIEKWYNGSAADADVQSGTTLLVFWEVWCPHCRREVPEIQKTYEKYKGRLDVVGLTKITKSATDEKVEEFIKEQGLTYPVAKEDGSATQDFAVSGVPAAAIVKDGKVVWRGHPGRINDEMIESYL